MNIEKIAEICHQVNKIYCESIGDFSQPNWENAPQWQKESTINGVKYHLNNDNTTPADSHNNWLKEKINNGWKYGKEKDPLKKTHPCIIPFEELPKEQQTKDKLFLAIVECFKKG